MKLFYISTDSLNTIWQGESVDSVAKEFAQSERVYKNKGIETLKDLEQVAFSMGGWATIKDNNLEFLR